MNYYHQVNRDGYYMYSFIPSESPREPGVLIIPTGATNLMPPSFEAGKEIPRITPEGWVLEQIPQAKIPFFKRIMDKFRCRT